MTDGQEETQTGTFACDGSENIQRVAQGVQQCVRCCRVHLLAILLSLAAV